MKILDVPLFHEAIGRNIVMLRRVGDELDAIRVAIEGFVALEDALKGKMGQAMRSFYAECHLPFLQFHATFNEQLIDTLERMRNAIDSVESNASGYIREDFLEEHIEEGLNQISRITEMLTEEANSIMRQVNDIVSLPHLDDDDVQQGITRAKMKRNETIQALYEFDSRQTFALRPFEEDVDLMARWLSELETLSRSGVQEIHFQSEQWQAVSFNSGLKKVLQREKESTLQACLVNDDQKSLIGQEITSETVQALKSLRTESIRRTPYGSYTLLNFHVYANGLVIKEYKIGNQATRYEAVEAVEAEFVEEGIRYSDSIFEETPLAFIDYVNPRLLVQKSARKFVFSRISGIKPAKYNTSSMKHIYHGEINRRGKAVGYHHESMLGGKIIPGTETKPDKKGIYRAKVEVDGVRKVADSSFFPKEWNRVDVLKAIDEAYQNKQKIGPNKYRGMTLSGIKIEMYTNRDGSIATAYPLYRK